MKFAPLESARDFLAHHPDIELFELFILDANSYRRLQANSYAPLAPTWGVDNRTQPAYPRRPGQQSTHRTPRLWRRRQPLSRGGRHVGGNRAVEK